MSKSIRVQLSKTLHTSKLEILLNSYTSLKSILSPNLSENNNSVKGVIKRIIFRNNEFSLFINDSDNKIKLWEIKK